MSIYIPGYGEEWRDVPGFEGHYQVSSFGNVRSVTRLVRCTSCRGEEKRMSPGKVLKPGKNRTGHLYVFLGKYHRRLVHRVVHLAFIGPVPAGLDVAHLDGNPQNNVPSNLSAVTRRENNQHVTFHGRRALTPDQVRLIRLHVKPGTPTAIRDTLAAQLGINRRHLNHVAMGCSYAYVV